MNVWIPLILLVINLIFSAFLIEELIDASEPNYGILGFFTPVIGLISFLYIKKLEEKSFLLHLLQLLNGLFIIFRVMIGY